MRGAREGIVSLNGYRLLAEHACGTSFWFELRTRDETSGGFDAQQGEKRQVVVRRIFANHCAAGDVVETVRASPRHQNHCCLGCCRVCSRIPSA